MTKKVFIGLILVTIVIINLLRFWKLDSVPYGFNVDELADAVTVDCMSTEGIDAHLNPHPVFAQLNYGSPIPPTYTYPGILAAKIFGPQAQTLRGLTEFFNVITVAGLFFLARLMVNTPCAVMVALVASLSPWGWGTSRIGYEATTSVTFLVWGIFLFLQNSRWPNRIAAALFFACAIYAYSPMRMQIPLVLAALFIFDLKDQKHPKRAWAAVLGIILLACLPMIQGIYSGALQSRFNGISIFNSDYLHSIGKSKNIIDLASVFFSNYFAHFKPQYLFISGDPSYEHSTQHFGLLSWLDIAGILSLLFFLIFRFKDVNVYGRWLLFLTVSFLLGIVPASLTDAVNHVSLRTIGAFPFQCLLTGFGLWFLCEHCLFFYPATAVTGVIFAFLFLRVFFFVYPEESKGWFSFWAKDEAMQATTDDDWLHFMVRFADQDYHFRYYMMNYHGESCTSSLEKWRAVRALLHLPQIY